MHGLTTTTTTTKRKKTFNYFAIRTALLENATMWWHQFQIQNQYDKMFVDIGCCRMMGKMKTNYLPSADFLRLFAGSCLSSCVGVGRSRSGHSVRSGLNVRVRVVCASLCVCSLSTWSNRFELISATNNERTCVWCCKQNTSEWAHTTETDAIWRNLSGYFLKINLKGKYIYIYIVLMTNKWRRQNSRTTREGKTAKKNNGKTSESGRTKPIAIKKERKKEIEKWNTFFPPPSPLCVCVCLSLLSNYWKKKTQEMEEEEENERANTQAS